MTSNPIPFEKLPKHLAIVMDGNGRWAEQRGLSRTKGHREGINAIKKTLESTREFGLKCLTIYAFSTENWSRSEGEVSDLMGLMSYHLKKEINGFVKNGIRLRILGDKARLDKKLQKELVMAEEKTAHNDAFFLNVALNYGSKSEIVEAVKNICSDVQDGEIEVDTITEDLFDAYLYTKDLPPVDLFVRTSGELRISNFLLWQSAYAEFYFTDVLWPDFNKEELRKALMDYATRRRRFGGYDAVHSA